MPWLLDFNFGESKMPRYLSSWNTDFMIIKVFIVLFCSCIMDFVLFFFVFLFSLLLFKHWKTWTFSFSLLISQIWRLFFKFVKWTLLTNLYFLLERNILNRLSQRVTGTEGGTNEKEKEKRAILERRVNETCSPNYIQMLHFLNA